MPTEVHVGTSISRVYEEVPNTLDITIQSAIRNNRNISNEVLRTYTNRLSSAADAFYTYGANRFIRRLPTVSYTDAGVSSEYIAITLKEIEQQPVRVFYSAITPLDIDFLVWEYMSNEWGYDVIERNLANPPIDEIDEDYYFSRVEVTPDRRVEVTFLQRVEDDDEQPAPNMEVLEVPIDISGLNTSDIYAHAAYVLLDASGEVIEGDRFFTYRLADNTYPHINENIQEQPESEYFPVMVLRESNKAINDENISFEDLEDRQHRYHSPLAQNLLDELGTDENGDINIKKLYRSNKRLANKFRIGYDDLLEALEENPDIDQVDHAYMTMAIPLNTTNKDSLEYLYTFFRNWVNTARLQQEDDEYEEFHYNSPDRGRNWFSIPTANIFNYSESFLNIKMFFHYGVIEVRNETIGDIGTIVIRNIEATGEDVVNINSYFDIGRNHTTEFIKQVSEGVVEVIRLRGLSHFNYAYSDHAATSYAWEVDYESTDPSSFIIPVDRALARSFGRKRYESIIADSAVIIVNAVDVNNLSWYETEAFRIVLIVVAVVALVFGAYELAVQIIAAETLLAAAIIILQAVAIAVVVKVGVDLLIDVFGLEGTLFAAVLAAVVAYFTTGQIDIGTIVSISAEQLLNITLAVINEVGTEIADAVADVQNEINELLTTSEEALDELDEELEELSPNADIEALVRGNPQPVFNYYESPSQFYNRTIHIGNIGTLALDQVAEYVDNALLIDLPNSPIRLGY